MIHFAIPFYSNVPFLQAAIESVLAQTVSDWRLVVIDDRGPASEGAEALVRRFADERITFRRNPVNLGIAGNWNACLDAVADAEFVCILHADDRLEPEYAAAMLEAAARHPDAAALFCRSINIDEDGRPVTSFLDWYKNYLMPSHAAEFELRGEEGIRAVIPGDFVIWPTMLYRMSRIGSERFEAKWRQVLDMEYLVRLLVKGEYVLGLNRKLFQYRRHPESQTSLLTESLRRFDEEVGLYNEIARATRQRGWTRASREAARKRVIKLHLLFCIVNHLAHVDVRQAWEKTRYLARLWQPVEM